MPIYAYQTQHINICIKFEDMYSNRSYNDIIKVLIKHYTQSKKSRICFSAFRCESYVVNGKISLKIESIK